MSTTNSIRRWFAATSALAMVVAFSPVANAHPDGPDDGGRDGHDHLVGNETGDYLAEHDAATSAFVSSGPSASVIKNLTVAGRGERLGADATTDVWYHDDHAYTGTFNSPCNTPEAGVWVWDVEDPNHPTKVGVIVSEPGDRTNDVKVAAMNSGDVLVMSNEACGPGGDGGFEIYDVNDPGNPVKLASVVIDELNPIADALFGGLTELGVHNLWLFTQGDRDYVAAVSEGAFDNFRIYDITDPADPELVSGWGAEELFDAGVGDETVAVGRVLDAALWLLDGYGASANRFLHDVTITADGTGAYLSNWDAGLVLLDISDPSDPQVVSVAIDPDNGSLDGEVNSHSAWPSEDGTIVVEGEEDFSAWEGSIPPSNLTLDSSVPGDPTIPATAISTDAGDFFEATPTGLTGSTDGSSVVVDGGPTFDAVELATAAGSPTFADTGTVSGDLVYIGRGCSGDPILNADAFDAGDIAVVRRGACFFEDKANTAASLGAAAVIIANNQASTPWSGLRIWDYSDPASPVLASLFDTTCSAASSPVEGCDPAGTYSSHNVVVETRGNTTLAYVSWYWDGVVVIDVTDPYDPVEVARYSDQSEAFQDQNAGPQDVWGIYKTPDEPWIYTSDRNGGLYVLKAYGQGSTKKGKANGGG